MTGGEGDTAGVMGPASIRRGSALASATLLAALVALVSAPRSASSQAPGYQRLPIGGVRAEYVAEVLDRLTEVQADWGEHWAADQIDDLIEMYSEDALLMSPDGTMNRGHDALRTYFEAALPTMGSVEAFMLDFDASGEMSQVFGNYALEVDGVETRGPMLTVYIRRGRQWRIRTQVFMPPG